MRTSLLLRALPWLLLAAPAWADYTTTLQTLAVTNHTGYVIDADATKIGAPARSVVAGSVSILYKRAGGVIGLPDSVTYTLTWSLVDGNDQAQALDTGGTSFDTTQVVNWPGGISELALTSTVNLNPAARLDFNKVYRLRVTATPASNGNATTYTDAVSRSYGHFTNTTSPDAALNVLGVAGYAEIDRDWVITSPTVPGPQLDGTLFMARYDDFNEAAVSANIPVRLRAVMRDVTDPMNIFTVPLQDASADHTQALLNHTNIGDNPATALPTFSLTLLPQNLNRSSMYQTTAIFEYQEANGDFVSLGEIATAPQPIFPVSGVLWFGTVKTRFTELAGVPTAAPVERWNLVVPDDMGYVDGMPNHTFGGTFVVSINDTPGPSYGDATVVSVVGGPVSVTAPSPDWDAVAGVRFNREDTTLDENGAETDIVNVYFPTGFTVSVPAAVGGLPETNAVGKVQLRELSMGAGLRPEGTVQFTPLQVRQMIDPGANSSDNVFYCAHEKLPAWFKASALGWNTATGAFPITPAGTGEFRWVRDFQMTFNETLHTQPASNANPPLISRDSRPSNDSYLRNAHNANFLEPRSFAITTNTTTHMAVLTARVPLASTQVRPHYPQGTATGAEPNQVEGFAMASGVLQITNNVVDTMASGLSGVTEVRQRYARDPVNQRCEELKADDGELVLHPAGGMLRFTPELGLLGDGTLESAGLQWGTVDKGGPGGTPRFAHQTSPFTLGAFYQPGVFLGGSEPAPSQDQRAATLLLSGRGTPTDSAILERPLESADAYHMLGEANYAGLNLRVAAEPPGMEGTSFISNQNFGPYPLKTTGKYYVQRGGVTGKHERQTTVAPISLTLFKFPATLQDFKFAYLDNHVKDSLTDGSIVIPFPAGVTQAFESLLLNERGQPLSARMPSGPQAHDLDHWGHLPFVAHSIGFQDKESADACNPEPPDVGYVEMGASFSNLMNAIPGHVHATLGFKAVIGPGNVVRGELMTAADGVPALDSRLHLPGAVKVDVPGPTDFQLTPITKAAFSNSANKTAGDCTGFLSVAGYLGAPFFRELAVHAHLQPDGEDSGIHLMGGWTDGPQSFFTHPGSFDAGQVGMPANVERAAYRRPAAPDSPYRIIARKTWLDVVNFKYPLAWNAATKRFAGSQGDDSDVLLFHLHHKLRSLSANGAELEFGAEIPRLPQINPQRLILDQLDGLVLNNAFSSFDNTLRTASDQLLNATGITSAVDAVDRLITDRVDRLIEQLMAGPVNLLTAPLNAVSGPVDAMVLQALDQIAEENFDPLAQMDPDVFIDKLRQKLREPLRIENAIKQTIGSTAADAQTLLKDILGPGGKLHQLQGGITTLKGIIERDVMTGKREVFRKLVDELAKGDGPSYALIQGASGLLAEQLDELEEVQDAVDNPFFDDLETLLDDASDQIDHIRTEVADVLKNPLWTSANEQSGSIANAIDSQIERVIKTIVPPGVTDLRDYFGTAAGTNNARLRLALRRMIMDSVLVSPVTDRLQSVLRTNFAPLRGVVRESMDQILSQVTTTIKEALHEQLLSGASPNNPLSGLGDADVGLRGLDEFFKGAHLRGYARTVGHSIAELRLDGGIKFKPPGMGNGMEFSGYFIFKDVHNKGPTLSCLGVAGLPGVKSEVRAGARLGSRSKPIANPDGGGSTAFFDNMAVGADLHFALNGSGVPLGFDGTLDLRGPLEFGLITIDGVKLAANFSAANQYLIASADGQIVKLINATVDIFAGHACNLAETGVINGPLTHILSDSKFGYNGHGVDALNLAGVVCRINGRISVNDVLKNVTGSVTIPKELVDIGFKKETIYAMLLRPPQPNTAPSFILGYSEFGRLTASAFGEYDLVEVDVSVAGMVQFPLSLDAVTLSAVALGVPPVNSIHFTGEAKLEGPIFDYPKLGLKLNGVMGRKGISFSGTNYTLNPIPGFSL